MNIKLDIPEKFFEGEERSGYYVSPLMKKVWAVQLDLLAEFARVCEKHNIKWWMDAGTLLGAARHKGFIPWDDDVDVMMMRKDYEHLLRIADDEFKKPYYMYSDYTTRRLAFAKFHNEDTTMFEHSGLNMLKNKVDPGYSQGIFIDVFPLDSLPDDDSEITSLCGSLHALTCPVAETWYERLMHCTDYYGSSRSSRRQPIKAMIHYLLYPVNPFLGGLKKYLRKKLDKSLEDLITLLRKLNYPDSHRIAKLVFVSDPKFMSRRVWERSWFDETVYLPFEMLTLPAPAGYEKILDHFYGNWHEFVIRYKHGDFYDTEHPYTYYTQEGHIPE